VDWIFKRGYELPTRQLIKGDVMKLIFIHGRSQGGKNPDALKSQWQDALVEGLDKAGLVLPSDLEISFPFYADHLDQLVEVQQKTPNVKVNIRGDASDSGLQEFQTQFLSEIAGNVGLTQEDISEYSTDVTRERGPANWGWIQSMLEAIDKNSGFGDKALNRYTKDVFTYLTSSKVQDAVDQIVIDHFDDEPCLVVGHSLGSIVGYNVLRKLSPKVSRYITLGSPLALKSVKTRLNPLPITMPDTTGYWFNAYDERDVVALFPLDEDNFPIQPSILNYGKVDNTTDNRHGISGYLSDPFVAQSIYVGLGDLTLSTQ